MRYFYKTKSGGEAGPVSRAILSQLMLAGEIKASTLVRDEDGADWVPYSELKEKVGDSVQETQAQLRNVAAATMKAGTAAADAVTQAADSVRQVRLGRKHFLAAGIAVLAVASIWLVPFCRELANSRPSEPPLGAVRDQLVRLVRVDPADLPEDPNRLPQMPVAVAPGTVAAAGAAKYRGPLTRLDSVACTYEPAGGGLLRAKLHVLVKATDDILLLDRVALADGLFTRTDLGVPLPEPNAALEAAFNDALRVNQGLSAQERVAAPAGQPALAVLKFKQGEAFACDFVVTLRKQARPWGFLVTLRNMFKVVPWLVDDVDEPASPLGAQRDHFVPRGKAPAETAVVGESSCAEKLAAWQEQQKAFGQAVRAAVVKREEDERQKPYRALATAQQELAARQAALAKLDAAIKAGEGGLDGVSKLLNQRKTQETEVQVAERVVARAKDTLSSTLRGLFEKDYAAFLKIADNSDVPEALKLQAWRELTTKWKVAVSSDKPVKLAWRDGGAAIARGRVDLVLSSRWPDQLPAPEVRVDGERSADLENGRILDGLAVGPHTLRIVHEAMQPFESTFEVEENVTARFTWKPQFLPTQLRFSIKPDGLPWRVTCNGQVLPVAEGTAAIATGGRQQLVFEAPGYRSVKREVLAEFGKTIEVDCAFAPLALEEILSKRDNPDIGLFPTGRRTLPTEDVAAVWTKAKTYFQKAGLRVCDERRHLLVSRLWTESSWSSIYTYQIVVVAKAATGVEVQVTTVIYYQSVMSREDLERSGNVPDYRDVGGYGNWYVRYDKEASKKASNDFLNSF